MRDEIKEILLLQRNYTSVNTEAMKRRGVLVRSQLPVKIRQLVAEFPSESRIEDFSVAGSDGIGRKTIVPWTRVHSVSRSPRPTSGWYAVYLFSRGGHRAYLSLIQGTASWDAGELKRQPKEKLATNVSWARRVLGVAHALPEGWTYDMNLDGPPGGLGQGYELGSVISAEYSVTALPDDVHLANHLTQALTWLETLYRLEDAGIHNEGDAAEDVLDNPTTFQDWSGMGQKGQPDKPSEASHRLVPDDPKPTVAAQGEPLLKPRDEAYAQLTAEEILAELEQAAGPSIQRRVVELLSSRINGALNEPKRSRPGP